MVTLQVTVGKHGNEDMIGKYVKKSGKNIPEVSRSVPVITLLIPHLLAAG